MRYIAFNDKKTQLFGIFVVEFRQEVGPPLRELGRIVKEAFKNHDSPVLEEVLTNKEDRQGGMNVQTYLFLFVFVALVINYVVVVCFCCLWFSSSSSSSS